MWADFSLAQGDGPQMAYAAILFVAGTCWGSFAATLAERWPAGQSIVHPRSRCVGCNRTLGVRDLVPILSYVCSRGRCRTCGARIPGRYPWTEGASGLLGLVAGLCAPWPEAVWLALLGWQLLLLALLDIEHLWLPDRLTAPLAATGLAYAVTADSARVADALIGGVAGFASLYILARLYRQLRHRDGLGQGDAKLLGAIGLWTGWQALSIILFGAALLGLLAALFLSSRGRAHLDLQSYKLPFGACMAVSTWLWLVADQTNLALTLAIWPA